jgi:molecular chaperone DnaK (HSP70)
MVVGTAKGEWHPVNDYEGAPVIYGGRAKDISEVPSLISVTRGTRGPSFTNGYKARTIRGTTVSNLKSMMPYITDQTSAELAPNTTDQMSAKLGSQITDKTFAELRAQMTEKLSNFGLTAQDLITKILEYLHAHLETWCDSRKLQVLPTCKMMASHPVYWKAETILEYQKMLGAAGFQNVDMVNEGEAAANTVLAGLSISEPENLLFCDLGGETWVS